MGLMGALKISPATFIRINLDTKNELQIFHSFFRLGIFSRVVCNFREVFSLFSLSYTYIICILFAPPADSDCISGVHHGSFLILYSLQPGAVITCETSDIYYY